MGNLSCRRYEIFVEIIKERKIPCRLPASRMVGTEYLNGIQFALCKPFKLFIFWQVIFPEILF